MWFSGIRCGSHIYCSVKPVWRLTYDLCTLSLCRPAGSECLGFPRRTTSGLFGARSCKLWIDRNTTFKTATKLYTDKRIGLHNKCQMEMTFYSSLIFRSLASSGFDLNINRSEKHFHPAIKHWCHISPRSFLGLISYNLIHCKGKTYCHGWRVQLSEHGLLDVEWPCNREYTLVKR